MRPHRPLYTHRFESPLGPVRLAASASGLCGLWFEGQKHGPTETVTAQWTPAPEHPWLLSAEAHVLAYFSGQNSRWSLPLDLSYGTPFQQSVWHALLRIPVGASQSYGELAHQLGKPLAVRAVGAAVGRNPVSIIVPCHRILGATGQLTGYAGGLWRKQALLNLEGHPAAA
jgi:methylated-DNA-[protein]-cysteine S-methyltransferase